MAGREVDCELIASSRQWFYGHPCVLLLTFTIHDFNDINLIFLSKMLNCPAVPYVQQHLEPTSISHTHPLTEEDRSSQFVCHSLGFLFQPCAPSLLFKGADTEQWMEKVHRDCCNHIDSAPKTTFDLTAAPCVDTGGRNHRSPLLLPGRRMIWREFETAMDHGIQSVTHVIMIRVVSAGNAQLRSRSA